MVPWVRDVLVLLLGIFLIDLYRRYSPMSASAPSASGGEGATGVAATASKKNEEQQPRRRKNKSSSKSDINLGVPAAVASVKGGGDKKVGDFEFKRRHRDGDRYVSNFCICLSLKFILGGVYLPSFIHHMSVSS